MHLLYSSQTATALAAIASDATATIWEMTNNANIVRVPKYLVVIKPAGTAYTVSAGSRLYITNSRDNRLFELQAEGFLDQTTAEGVLLLPSTGAFKLISESNPSDDFLIGFSGTLSGAGPTVELRMAFEEVGVAG